MNFDKNTTYYCFGCGSFTSVLHEIIYGNLYRRLSIEYNIQLPLCTVCHHEAHHSRKKYDIRDKMLKYLDTSFEEVIKAYQSKQLREPLTVGLKRREYKIKKLEV